MMPAPKIDWSFDNAPADDAAPYDLTPGPRGDRPPRPRWLFPSIVVVVLVAVGALGVYIQVGWSRLKAQIAAQVAYEDSHAWQGDVALVQAVQAQDDPAWLARRGGEVRLGLAAPLPAANLAPAPDPPRVVAVTPLGGDQFQVDVARRYLDSAGQAYDFVLPERFRNPAPGLWARLPPDLGALINATTFYSQNLTARLPVADLPWLSGPLQQADQALGQACADWAQACSARQPVRMMFAGQLEAQPLSQTPGLGAAARLGAYPLVFDLPSGPGQPPLRWVGQMVLASPHLAGLPRDAASSKSLGNSLAVQSLDYLATRLTSGTLSLGDLFRQALVAREEARLGLTPPPANGAANWRSAGHPYVPPARLWNTSLPENQGQQLSYRLQALAFLNYALAHEPASADGLLLKSLASQPASLTVWLDGVLHGSAGAVINQWNSMQLSGPTQSGPALNGLAYTCSNQVWMVRGGRPQLLFTGRDWVALTPDALSPDGRYLALTSPTGVYVMDPATGATHWVAGGDCRSVAWFAM